MVPWWFQVGAGWLQGGSNLVPGWFQVVPGCFQVGLRRFQVVPGRLLVVPVWLQGGFGVVPWWFQCSSRVVPGCFQVVLGWFQCGSRVVPRCFQDGSSVVPGRRWWLKANSRGKTVVSRCLHPAKRLGCFISPHALGFPDIPETVYSQRCSFVRGF